MKPFQIKAIAFLSVFFILVFTVAFIFNPHFPKLIIAGENSVGTWMSGVLLVVSATLCLLTGLRKHKLSWLMTALFFLVLALDERFMFHEQIKEFIIFRSSTSNFLIYELPVIIGACIGCVFAYFLWTQLSGTSRILLCFAVVFGVLSVIFDVLSAGVLPEDCFKLLAELLITCSLFQKLETVS